MDLGLTVKDLAVACMDEINKGNGAKHIIISDDDEGNGFHTLFYLFSPYTEDFADLEHDAGHNENNCIVLG